MNTRPQPDDKATATATATAQPGDRPATKPSIASVQLPPPGPVDPAVATAVDHAACGIEPARAASAPLAAADVAAREERAARALEQTLAAMHQSANPRARAAALMLKPLIAELERAQTDSPSAACEPSGCVPIPRPAAAVAQARAARPDAAADASIDPLAGMAAATTDPRIYALAFHACDVVNARRAGACQMINAGQWARLDPGNAAPWVYVAAMAQQQGDAATVSEAMHQIAQANRSDHGWGVLPGLVLEHAPTSPLQLEAVHQLLVSTIAVESVWVIPGYQTISPHCKAELMADPNRRETCGQIAEVLAERSDTLLDRSFGASIGKRVGWPTERTDAIKAEFAALSQAVANMGADPDQPTCAGLRRELDYVRSLGAYGEVGAMRRLAGSGPSKLGAAGGDKASPAGHTDRAN